MNLIEHLISLLEQLRRDVDDDLRQARLTLSDTRDEDFLSRRATLIVEIERTFRVNLAHLRELQEVFGDNTHTTNFTEEDR